MKSRCVFDVAGKRHQVEALDEESLAPDFYADRQRAQRQMQLLSRLRDEVTLWEGLSARLADLHELAVLLEDEPAPGLADEVARAVAGVEAPREPQRFLLMLSGEPAP